MAAHMALANQGNGYGVNAFKPFRTTLDDHARLRGQLLAVVFCYSPVDEDTQTRHIHRRAKCATH